MSFAQQSINFFSQVPTTGTYSNASAWNSSGGFTFELGTFQAGFTPTAFNVSLWSANWTVANQGASGTTTWLDDGGDTGFAGAGRITSLAAPFTGGKSLYIWGFDSKSDGSREWILLSNTSWVVSNDISNPISSNFAVNGSTSAVLGTIGGSGTTLQSAPVSVSAIPEPASVAGLLGFAALGYAATRRRRSVA